MFSYKAKGKIRSLTGRTISCVCLPVSVAYAELSGSGVTGDSVDVVGAVSIILPKGSDRGFAFSNVAITSTGLTGSTSNDPWIIRS